MQIKQVEFRLCSINDGLAEGDWKTNGGVFDLIVVRKIVFEAAVIVGTEPEFSEEGLRKARFVVVPLRRLDGKLEGDGIEHSGCGGTREQNVFERGGLKDSVVGKMQDEIC